MRTFIAVELDDAIRQRLAEAQDRLRRAGASVKWVRPELMHITLRFLGEIDEDAIEGLERVMAAAAEGVDPFRLTVQGLGAFPPHGAPRVLWAGVQDDGILALLHRRVQEGVVRLDFEPETRPFSAHLTLGRVKSPRGAGALRGPLAANATTEFGSCLVREIVLMLSVLSPAGPTYTVLRRRPL